MANPGTAPEATPLRALLAVTVLVGMSSGLAGMSLGLLLHFVQHVAYHYRIGPAAIVEASFLQGVIAARPIRRVTVMATCGLVAGIGWWALHRFCRPLVGVGRAVATGARMPVLTSTLDALLQIVTVAMGAPLGREGAPRELGGAIAGWLSGRTGLTASDGRTMVACGAGAGLAAVYNVPLGGTLFVLEVLLRTFRFSAVVPALATSVIAAVVAWIGLGDEVQYTVAPFTVGRSLVVWSIVAGPIFGFAAYWFARLTTASRARAPRDWRLLAWCPPTLLAIGLIAIPFPQVLGNGKGPTQLGFDSDIGVKLATTLLVIKVLAIAASLRAGVAGGVLTPSVTIGALLAIVLGGIWSLAWPAVPSGAFAIVGAAAFLASSMRMPLTAIVLIIELTGVRHDVWIPIVFAVAGSVAACRLMHGSGRPTS